MKRLVRYLLLISAAIILIGVIGIFFSYVADAPATSPDTDAITIGWVGDMVPGDALYNTSVFTGVSPLLEKPDLMIGNLEGTFAHEDRISKCNYLFDRCHAFRGDASFAFTLKSAGFDFISLVNNHSYDFGDDGLSDTQAELSRVGMAYISPTHPTTSITVKGKRIGIMGLSSTPPAETISDYTYITKTVQTLKKNNDIVIVIMHAGAEGSDKTVVPNETEYMGTENRGDVALVAHTAIDAGADLILGSGPHVLRKIETYNSKTIAYSLGNFVGGNGKLVTSATLGISGIFSATLSHAVPQRYFFSPVALTKNGIPFLDTTDQGSRLVQFLSK